MTAVFACQGWGSLASALVPFILVSAYKQSILHSIEAQNGNEAAYIDAMWRIIIGLGVIPSCIALYTRLTIPETFRFTMDIRHNISEAVRDIGTSLEGTSCAPGSTEIPALSETLPAASWEDLRLYFSQLRNFKAIFGTAYSWFALDVSTWISSFLIC